MQTLDIAGIKIRKYDSINEFKEFIDTAPDNTAFQYASKESREESPYRTSWAGTSSYSEAIDLLVHGSDDLSKKLEKKYQVATASFGERERQKSYYDVGGFQASVPRYLQGVPTAMINSHKVPQKDKIISINKDISYGCSTSTQEIIDSSVQVLALVKQLELTGFRVNVSLCWRVKTTRQDIGCKIRLKNASERLNISKLSFLLAHPSMLRRVLLKWLEVNPDVTDKSFTRSYGSPSNVAPLAEKGEYTLPKFITNINDITDAIIKR